MTFEELQQSLVIAIEDDNLVVLCGAGASMDAPSCLPSAAKVGAECRHRFKEIFTYELPEELGTDLEKIAQHFFANTQLPTFLLRVVDWTRFIDAVPNECHKTLADFLLCGATNVVVSTNYDTLVEDACRTLGQIDFDAVIDGNKLNDYRPYKPLLKIHGCRDKEKEATVWCVSQLDTAPIKDRLEVSKEWLTAQLRNRVLLIIGFWTDWKYLNEILLKTVGKVEPRLVVLVDPDTGESIKAKATQLWEWANQRQVQFHHERAEGAPFLRSLRSAYSASFLNRLLNDSAGRHAELTGNAGPAVSIARDEVTADDYYELRRDTCGVPRGHPVKEKRHPQASRWSGVMMRILLQRGAQLEGPYFRLHGALYRVRQADMPLSAAKAQLSGEPQDPIPINYTICAGARPDGGAPSHLVRDTAEDGQGIVRGGQKSTWLTLEQAIAHLEEPA